MGERVGSTFLHPPGPLTSLWVVLSPHNHYIIILTNKKKQQLYHPVQNTRRVKNRQLYFWVPSSSDSCERLGWKALKQRLNFKAKHSKTLIPQDISEFSWLCVYKKWHRSICLYQRAGIVVPWTAWMTWLHWIICFLLASNICMYFHDTFLFNIWSKYKHTSLTIFTFLLKFTKHRMTLLPSNSPFNH